MKEIDMTPYEEYFTELERLYFEQNACMNIVIYLNNSNNNFTKDQYEKVFNDYVQSLKAYENYISVFETNVVLPSNNNQPTTWRANFTDRVIYCD